MADNLKNSFKNEEENNLSGIDNPETPGIFSHKEDTDSSYKDSDDIPAKSNTKIQLGSFKWHWLAVFAVAVIVIYLSLLNGVSLESALTRSLYCTAIFWIIAEVVDWVIHKMN